MKAIMAETFVICHVLYTSISISHTGNHPLINVHVAGEFYNYYIYILQPCMSNCTCIIEQGSVHVKARLTAKYWNVWHTILTCNLLHIMCVCYVTKLTHCTCTGIPDKSILHQTHYTEFTNLIMAMNWWMYNKGLLPTEFDTLGKCFS